MVGRRWATDITEAIDSDVPDWAQRTKFLAHDHGVQQPGYSVDYFAFRRGLYASMPPLVIRPRLVGSLAGLEGSSTGSGSSRCLRPSDRHSSKS
jgi:hypothetical protein